MILVHKPPLSQSPLHAHSPPQTVVMRPTHTPGLFTLSQPPRPTLKRKPHPKSKSTTAEITDNKKSGMIATPLQQRHGRGQVNHTNDRAQNQTSIPPSPSPLSRKSAKHKQHTPSSLVTPVPVTPRRRSPNISPPDRLPSHIHQRPRSTYTLQHIPICDDMNDEAVLSPPTTPPPTHRDHYNNLRSAPISSRKPGAFPVNTISLPSSPSTPPNKRKHHKTPSEGTFMSSDDDLSSGPDGTSLNPNVRALFGLVNNFKPSSKILPSTPIRAIPPFRKGSTSPSYRSLRSKCEASEKAVGYFASSMFQNSPSPEELPDPPIF